MGLAFCKNGHLITSVSFDKKGRCKACHREQVRTYYYANKERCINNARKWALSNTEKRREIINKYDKKAREDLSDNYIRKLLCIKKDDCDETLADLKRLQIKLKRGVKHGPSAL